MFPLAGSVDSREDEAFRQTMTLSTLILMVAAILAGFLGFGYLQGSLADWTQFSFFALLIASLASLVFDRRRPI